MSNVQLKNCQRCCTSPVICPHQPFLYLWTTIPSRQHNINRVQHGIWSAGVCRAMSDKRWEEIYRLAGLSYNWKLIWGHEGAAASNIIRIQDVSALDLYRTTEKQVYGHWCLKLMVKTLETSHKEKNNLKTLQTPSLKYSVQLYKIYWVLMYHLVMSSSLSSVSFLDTSVEDRADNCMAI